MTVGDQGATRDSAERFDQTLRACALREESGDSESFDLGDLWRDLNSGRCQIADSFHSEARCYLVLVPGSGQDPKHQNARSLEALERLLLEESQKQVALSLGVSTSTIAGLTKNCLTSMGLHCPPSKVPPLLVMAAQASRGQARLGDERRSLLHDGTTSFQVISAIRPDNQLAGVLPRAEFAVARLLVDGKSHAEIASLRGSSRRTVANQLASVFQRLGVSGRADLLRYLGARRAACQPAALPIPTPGPKPDPDALDIALDCRPEQMSYSPHYHALLRGA